MAASTSRLFASVALAVALGLMPSACAAEGDGVGDSRADIGAGTVRLAEAGDASDLLSGLTAGDSDAEAAEPRPSAAALGHYLAARTAQFANDIDSAATHYSQALEADPENLMLMRRAYYYLTAAGRFDEAVAVARHTLEVDPEEDFAPLLLASAAMRDGRFADALETLKTLKPEGLNGLLQPLMAAWAALAAERGLEAATPLLEPARRLTSARGLVDLHAALLAHVAGRPDEASRRLDAYLDAGPPQNVRPLELTLALLVALDRTEDAQALIGALAQGSSLPVTARTMAARLGAGQTDAITLPVDSARAGFAEALYHIGLVLNQGQGSDTAIVLMRLASAVKPDFARADLAIAETLRRMEQFAAANAQLDSLDAGDDTDLDYLRRLYRAENLEHLDQIDEALTLYDALAEAYPERVDPLVDKGDLLRRDEQYRASADAYAAALTRMDDGDPLRWPVLYRRGIALERAGAWDEAEADFLRALELEPDQADVLNYLGYSWLDRGEHIERAVEMIREAVRQRPEDGYIVDSLGWGYYLLARYEDAVRQLERAVELRPQDPTINDHLGDAYWQVGRRAEARFQWERALSLEPEPDQIETITRKLEEGLKAAPEAETVRETGG
jgi:tetratricopeptide (TPR) repeat protein